MGKENNPKNNTVEVDKRLLSILIVAVVLLFVMAVYVKSVENDIDYCVTENEAVEDNETVVEENITEELQVEDNETVVEENITENNKSVLVE